MAHISERVPGSLKRSPSLDSAKAKDTAITLTGDVEVAHDSEEKQSPIGLYPKLRPYILTALALLILGWWISATVLKATRHRWYALYVPPLASKLLMRKKQDRANHLRLGFYSVGMPSFTLVFTCTFICLA